MDIKKIGIAGAGQMGSGIAQVALNSGFEVVLNDISDNQLKNGQNIIEKGFSKLVQKEKITESQKKEFMSKLSLTSLIENLAGCDIVIEAATENKNIKFEIFKKIDSILNEKGILATNTSSISITELAAATKRPDKVIGMHFMNPVPVMKLVELIRGLQTNDDTYNTVKSVSEKMEKITVMSQDYPGFIVNRILLPMINDAIFVLMEGVGSAEDIDNAMKLGTNQPMGPLALADFIGLDTCLSILEVMYDGFGDLKYKPCPLLKKYVNAGYLGKKTGKGFYKY